MPPRVSVKPALLQWACDRAQVDLEKLRERFPKYDDWESGTLRPTLRQVENFARFTHVPVGTLFMSEPMHEEIPINDLRIIGNQGTSRPSDNLLDIIYLCQQRQDWYEGFAVSEEIDSLPFVGSATINSDVPATAKEIQTTLGFGEKERKELLNWIHALRYFVDQVDDLGILIMISGVFKNNPHRKLDPQEFRGFALADDLVPLIFINGADSKAVQLFTIAHELAHIWLGESSLSDVAPDSFPSHETERWCSQVAAELLVPAESLHENFRDDTELSGELHRLSRHYKVSTPIMLRRLFDIGTLQHNEFMGQYRRELAQVKLGRENGGGNFHARLRIRVGRQFGSALVASTLSGQTSFTDAFYYLGIRKASTLKTFAESLTVGN